MNAENGQGSDKKSTSTLDALWKEYKESGSNVAKDKLLVNYAYMVKYIAHRKAVSLPSTSSILRRMVPLSNLSL